MKFLPAHLPMPDSAPPPSDKDARLRQAGLLNPHPERVRDPRFDQSEFFDPRDILQVRYEMVRRVHFDKLTLAKAAERFGVSLPTCFRAVKAFARDGLRGLIPERRGPRGPHKITPAMLDFVDDYRAAHGRTSSATLVALIEQRFGVRLHPRGLEKALARREKKRSERP
ncbi:MAG: helix-turn-helix domain-containing protein [Bryobacterales bacterium]|nr:helix-turn-helix domain-containing protein [Bryobacterales bacterium]